MDMRKERKEKKKEEIEHLKKGLSQFMIGNRRSELESPLKLNEIGPL